jgi:hypothetical protein
MPCDVNSWWSLWDAFNRAQGETLKVRRTDLESVVQCAGAMPDGLVVRAGKIRVEVSRAALFGFLRDHARAPHED